MDGKREEMYKRDISRLQHQLRDRDKEIDDLNNTIAKLKEDIKFKDITNKRLGQISDSQSKSYNELRNNRDLWLNKYEKLKEEFDLIKKENESLKTKADRYNTFASDYANSDPNRDYYRR